jgi:polyvinyl alcohol dehydrogenase (cytochrome)
MRYKFVEPPKPGIYAVDADNGDMQWSMLAAEDTCGDIQFCERGVSAAVTAIPGAVIVPYLDGHVRIHSRKDGSVL